MQIKFRRASLAGPSDRSSAATRPIANIIQGANVDRRRSDNPFDPREPSRDSLRLTACDPCRSSPEIQPAINTHRPRSGRRFCPIAF
jgi:hypothetical protein